MMMQTFPFRLIAAVIMACLLSMPVAAADEEAVVEVTVVKIYGSTDEYLSKVKGIIDVIMKHEPRAEVHIYQAAFAGTDYGKVHISTRYPNEKYFLTTCCATRRQNSRLFVSRHTGN